MPGVEDPPQEPAAALSLARHFAASSKAAPLRNTEFGISLRSKTLVDVFPPGEVVGMQEFVAFVATGAIGEELLIDPGYIGILVGFRRLAERT